MIKTVNNIVTWTYLIEKRNCEENVRTFYEKELQKTNKTEFRIGKVIRKKGDKLYVKWKVYDNLFKIWIGKKKILLYKMSYFQETYSHSKNKIKVKYDFSNYITKSNLIHKNLTKKLIQIT